MSGDPFAELGLPDSATSDDVHGARRRLAKEHHPDVGGDPARMRAVNAAVAAALAAIAARRGPRPAPPDVRPSGPTSPPSAHGTSPTDGPDGRRTVHDHASFTIEALPAAAFEALVVVTSWIGEVLVDEPPYVLEAHLREPSECWCRLDLLPDAGASTVALTVASVDVGPAPDIDAVRDVWVAELNRLDWGELSRADQRPPS
ncbi:MAG: J domain-containing protein [Ilumatobacteraceae bacterium]